MRSFSLSQSQVGELALNVYDDYYQANEPFSQEMMPEHLVRGGFDTDTEYSLFLTLVASIDKRKETMGEDGLWKEAKRLWDDERTRWIFRPEQLVEEHDYDELIDLFTREELKRFNYFEDPHIWYLNSLSLYRYFDSDPILVLEEADFDAPGLYRLVNNDRYKSHFLSIGGEKIGPFWVRLMDEEIRDLRNIHDIEIPVDTRIQSITNHLLDADLSKTEVRKFWRGVCDETGLVPVRLDQPLWLIDKFLDEGDKYLEDGRHKFQDYLEKRIAEVV